MSTNKGVLGHRVSPHTVSITFDDGRPIIITTDNPNFSRIAAKLKAGDFSGLFTMCNPAEGIKSWFGGKVQIKGGSIFVNGKPVNGAIVPVILNMIKEGAKADHLLKFLVLLQDNPSMHSRDQLWEFIRLNNITIYNGPAVTYRDAGGTLRTRDMTGYIVLYKGVNDDYTDCHTGKFLNKPGTQLEMVRANVDDDQSRACSTGFHAGAFEYVRSFGDRKLVVLVNPADVVSVPHDCSRQKIRTCRYTVLKEVPKQGFSNFSSSTYSDDGKANYKVTFAVTVQTVLGDVLAEARASVRAIDVEHAIALVKEEYDVVSIGDVSIVA